MLDKEISKSAFSPGSSIPVILFNTITGACTVKGNCTSQVSSSVKI